MRLKTNCVSGICSYQVIEKEKECYHCLLKGVSFGREKCGIIRSRRDS